MCRRPLVPPAGSGITPEPTAPPNLAEEAALRQLQHQMRAIRAMPIVDYQLAQVPSEVGRGNIRHLQDLLSPGTFGGFDTSGGSRVEREDDRNEYAGMYS
jgi:hypothetical protein